MIEIELIIVEPIMLELGIAPSTYIGTAQAGPQGLPGPPGSGDFWETETEGTIKPANGKTIDATHLTGELFGGLFQP